MKLPKSSQPKASPAMKPVKGGYLHDKIVDRNLMGVSPLKQQFEPTDQSPVRQHFKMAGGCD